MSEEFRVLSLKKDNSYEKKKQQFIAKLFDDGEYQAFNLPKEIVFSGDEVLIHRDGERLIIKEKRK